MRTDNRVTNRKKKNRKKKNIQTTPPVMFLGDAGNEITKRQIVKKITKTRTK